MDNRSTAQTTKSGGSKRSNVMFVEAVCYDDDYDKADVKESSENADLDHGMTGSYLKRTMGQEGE